MQSQARLASDGGDVIWTVMLREEDGTLRVIVANAPHGESAAWSHLYNIHKGRLAAIIPGKNPVYFKPNKAW